MSNTTGLVVLAGALLVSGCKKAEPPATGSSSPAAGGGAPAASATPGVTATEIKIGQTMPYSGPASAYAVIGKTEVAYFKMINERGGIKGRKLALLSLDDGYAPPKAVEATRKLVESDGVAFLFGSVGTPSNSAVRAYLNDHKVPQLFIATGADKWADPAHFPWTIGWQPSYRTEARVYARYVLKERPAAKMCVLYQNDDFGKDYLAGLKDGFGDQYDKIVIKALSYEVTDPTVDSQIVTLQGAGCDTFLSATTPKFGANAIRKVADIGWKPLFFLSNVSASITAVLTPAGLDKSTGLITGQFLKDNSDPSVANDPEMNEYRAFMKQYAPDLDPNDVNTAVGYSVAANLVYVLTQCGDDLSRDNIMKQAASLKDYKVLLAIDGVTITTSATDFKPITQMRLARFNGKSYEAFGELISGD